MKYGVKLIRYNETLNMWIFTKEGRFETEHIEIAKQLAAGYTERNPKGIYEVHPIE